MKYILGPIFEVILYVIVEVTILILGVLVCAWHFENRFIIETWDEKLNAYDKVRKIKMISLDVS